MCGRFSFVTTKQKIAEQFQIELKNDLRTSYNIAPTHRAHVIINENKNKLRFFTWGLLPHWSRERIISGKLINARKEEISSKPSFRMPIRYKRCLVLADSFYEWRPYGKKKMPFRIMPRNNDLLVMAGIWDEWKEENKVLRSFSIITTTPNKEMKNIHSRMPVIFTEKEDQEEWLSDIPLNRVLDMTKTPPDNILKSYRVTDKLNSVKVDLPEFHEEILTPPTLFD